MNVDLMKGAPHPKAWLTLSLGAMNGLVAGVFASFAIYAYNEYSNWRLLYGDQVGELSAHFVRDVEPFIVILVLVLFVIAFSAASYVVHRFCFRRVQSVIRLWQYVAGGAVLFGVIIVTLIDLIDYSRTGFTTIRYGNLWSFEFARYAFLFLVAFSILNRIYGSLLLASAAIYGSIVSGPKSS